MRGCKSYQSSIRRDGFAIVDHVVSPVDVARLGQAIQDLPDGEAVRQRQSVYGVRNLLELSEDVRWLASTSVIRDLVVPVLGPNCFAVRATFFDKVPDANWKLRYHQDSVIAVRQRAEVPGFHAWSEKAGVLQVRPPTDVLQDMLSIRVHLDDCPAENGALKILAGSHRQRWTRDQLADCKAQYNEVICEVVAGGVLAMRPLVLHASAASKTPGHRRVIHIEFAAADLPSPLQWKQRVGPDG